ncbi:MAG: hypothetical protein QW165_00185 [Candidatus Woesearchaeota archaeon]
MKWIATLAILLVALAPVVLAEEATGGSNADNSEQTPREKAKERIDAAKDKIRVRIAEKAEIRAERKELRLERREDIKALRDQVKAACEADKTSEECKNARMDARDAKHILLGRIADKMGPTFKRAEQLEKRLTKIVEHLAKKGKDVSALDTSAINAKIADARALFDEGKKLFEDARAAAPEAKDGLMKQAAQKFREANNALKQARRLIVEWLTSVKRIDQQAIEATASTTAEDSTAAQEKAPAESSETASVKESTETADAPSDGGTA